SSKRCGAPFYLSEKPVANSRAEPAARRHGLLPNVWFPEGVRGARPQHVGKPSNADTSAGRRDKYKIYLAAGVRRSTWRDRGAPGLGRLNVHLKRGEGGGW